MAVKESLQWIVDNRKRLQYVLVMQSNVKFTLIWITFFIGSFSHDFFALPQSYFSSRRNVFNVVFVKKGWGWTLFFVMGYLFAILLKQRVSHPKVFYKHFGRLLVLSFVWYALTTLFEAIESYTGSCLGKDILNKHLCEEEGYMWSGFDISGHCFLLSFTILIINEELHKTNNFKVYARNGDQINSFDEDDIKSLKSLYGIEVEEKYLDYFLEIFSVLLTFIMLLWEVMLFFTCAYFHTLIQKLCGIIAGVGSAYICYGVIFKIESPYTPSVPSMIAELNHRT